jgi:hypothetical protein
LALLLLRLVSMAADYEIELGCMGMQVQLSEIVENIEGGVTCFHHPGEGQLLCPWVGIDIAADSKNWGDAFQPGQDIRVANVTCVDDQLHAAQGIFCLRTQQTMCIRNDSDEHCDTLETRLPGDEPLVLPEVLLGNIVLGDFPCMHFVLVRVGSIFDSAENFRLERLPFFQQLLHAFRIHVGIGGKALRVA